ncbi:MAG TPA: YdeI/OmpD-associated family protein [Streptosporangiaceae bacterium]|jgi:hypothetical protein|nr:YdeI/OmpD-associated family protein [Streptosporangiaceae bacterium]
MKFRAIIQLNGKTATGIEVPPEVITSLGRGQRPPVRVTIGGYTYRSTVGVMGGKSMLPVSADNRAAAGVAAGDEVEVDVVLDTAPREVTLPPEFAAALRADEAAQQAFQKLSYSQQQRHVLGITSAKTAETRERRIASALAELRQDRRS